MVEEGVLKNPDVDAIFGLHISANTDVGKVRYRHGGIMAANNLFKIVVTANKPMAHTHGKALIL